MNIRYHYLLATICVLLAATLVAYLLFRDPATVIDATVKAAPKIAKLCRENSPKHQNTWWCGPTAVALANHLNRTYYHGQLTVSTKPGYCTIAIIVGALQNKGTWTEHVWLEIYDNGKIVFIDPTHGQFSPPDTLARIFDDSPAGHWQFREFLAANGYHHLRDHPDYPNIKGIVALTCMVIDSGDYPESIDAWATELKLEEVKCQP